MKQIRWPEMVLAIAMIGGCKPVSNTTDLGDMERYSVDHGHIHYAFTGMRHGIQELYFDRHGLRERIVQIDDVREPAGAYSEMLTTIHHGSAVDIIDSVRHLQTHSVDTFLDSLSHLPAERRPSPENAFAQHLRSLGFRETDPELRMVYPVRVFVNPEKATTLKEWHGIILDQLVNRPEENYVMHAFTIDTLLDIDTNLFHVPNAFPNGSK